MSEKYGGAEFAMNARGLEPASYEPRSSVGMGLGYAVSNRGGCHLNGGYLALLESVGAGLCPAVLIPFFSAWGPAILSPGLRGKLFPARGPR